MPKTPVLQMPQYYMQYQYLVLRNKTDFITTMAPFLTQEKPNK